MNFLSKKAKKLPEEYLKLIESKPEFYKEIMSKLQELNNKIDGQP